MPATFDVRALETWTASESPHSPQADAEEITSDDGIIGEASFSGSDGGDTGFVAESDPIVGSLTLRAPLFVESDSSSTSGLADRFQSLVAQWKKESAFMSSAMDMVAMESYRKIIGLGTGIVPLLLRELQREVDHWFFALTLLTGEDPALEASPGRIDQMAALWLQWGKTKGYILEPTR